MISLPELSLTAPRSLLGERPCQYTFLVHNGAPFGKWWFNNHNLPQSGRLLYCGNGDISIVEDTKSGCRKNEVERV